MNRMWIYLVLAFVFPWSVGATPLHRWVCVDNGRNTLIHIDQRSPALNWSVPIPPGSRDLHLLKDNALLVSHGSGAAEYDLATGQRLRWVANHFKDIQTACRLENGHTLLASIGGTLYDLDAENKEYATAHIDIPELDIRLIRPTERNTLLIGAKNPMAVLEVTYSGTVLRTLPLPGKGYKAVLLPDGNILAGTGSAVTILTLTPAGNTVSYVGGKSEHPALELDFCSGWEQLQNGNIVMANWQGHGDFPNAPHLVEFSTKNDVVWTWNDHTMATQITNLLILDHLK